MIFKFLSIVLIFCGISVIAQASCDTIPCKSTFEVISDLNSNLLPQIRNSKENPELNNCTSILLEEDTYYLFYNDLIGGWPPEIIHMKYATSYNLEEWSRSDLPLVIEGLDYLVNIDSEEFPMLSDVIKTQKGKYHLYFVLSGRIGLAIGDHLSGPYHVYNSVVLSPSESEKHWDVNDFSSPDVVWDGLQYRMYYSVNLDGMSSPNPRMSIAMAISDDGIQWTKWNDPKTYGAFINSDPVFCGTLGDWDGYKVESPKVVYNDSIWIMIYRSDSGSNNWNVGSAFGLCYSYDGYNWISSEKNLIFTPNQNNIMTLWGAAALVENDVLNLFLEIDGPPIYGTRVIRLKRHIQHLNNCK